jgi:hypothetical protein
MGRAKVKCFWPKVLMFMRQAAFTDILFLFLVLFLVLLLLLLLLPPYRRLATES